MKNLFAFLAIVVVLTACRKSEFEPVERTSGDADFSRYISVGNSLTQGFQDGGVYEEGQEMSYPLIIAEQMQLVEEDMDDFDQPDVYGNGSGYMHLEYVNGELDVVSAGDPGGYDQDISWDSWGPKGPKYNNLGISGITVKQCVALDDNEKTVNNVILGGVEITFPVPYSIPGNPFARFLDFGGNSFTGGTPIQYLDHVKQSNATFFTCWLGNNDVLGYATSGGVVQSFDASAFGLGVVELNGLTDVNEFAMKYDSILTAFDNLGAKGVVATLPNVTSIPYFNTFTVQSLKDDFGYSEVWIETGTGDVRVATDDDLILLNAADTIELGAGSSDSQYLENGLVLDATEVSTVVSHTLMLNNVIIDLADQHDFGVVDVYTFLDDLKAGITFEGIDFTPKYVEGGAFSLDGIHLNPRGYAIVANEFIKTINETYNSNIPTVSIGNYRGVVFP